MCAQKNKNYIPSLLAWDETFESTDSSDFPAGLKLDFCVQINKSVNTQQTSNQDSCKATMSEQQM